MWDLVAEEGPDLTAFIRIPPAGVLRTARKEAGAEQGLQLDPYCNCHGLALN